MRLQCIESSGEVFEQMDRLEWDLNPKGGCQMCVRTVTLIVVTDHLIHTTLFQVVCPYVVDHLRESLSYHRILCEMEPHDVAEDVTPHDDGRPLEKSPSNTIGEHGEIAHVDHWVLNPLGLNPVLWDHHHDLLFRYGDRGWPDRLLFLAVHDQIEWMIIVWTILFAGIAGETI